MTRPKSIDLNIIVDQSGSMEDCKDATIEALNAYIVGQRKQRGRCTVTMAYFSGASKFRYVIQGESVQTCRLLTKHSYNPEGATALLDAIGRVIDDTGNRLASLPEGERPDKVLVVIITDGVENSSTTYTKAKVIDMVEHQRSKYQWEFVFLAADIDKIATEAIAHGVGIHANTMSYGKRATRGAIELLCVATANYRETEENTCSNFFDLGGRAAHEVDVQAQDANKKTMKRP